MVMNQEYMSQLENKANKVPGVASKGVSSLGLTFNDNSYLVRQLKKTVKALHLEIRELNQSISQLKKDTKYTNVKEVQAENQELIIEINKISELLKEQLRQNAKKV